MNQGLTGAPLRRGLAVRGLAAAAASLLAAPPLGAQVGHDPARSPFRDLTTRQGLSVAVGRFAGNAAAAGVGALPGPFVALRLDTRLSGPVDFWASVARIASSRRVVDATADSATRVSGPIAMPLVAADIGLALNLTGPRTWRQFAPYVGIGMGVMAPSETRIDPGGYRAGSNFSFVPTAGTRLFVGRALALRVEARDYYFRYEWPLAYFSPVSPEGVRLAPVLDPLAPGKQWTHNFTLSAGLTYAFTF